MLYKEYVNMATFKVPVLLLIRSLTFDLLNIFLRHHIQELYTFKMVRFLAHHVNTGSFSTRLDSCKLER